MQLERKVLAPQDRAGHYVGSGKSEGQQRVPRNKHFSHLLFLQKIVVTVGNDHVSKTLKLLTESHRFAGETLGSRCLVEFHMSLRQKKNQKVSKGQGSLSGSSTCS